MKFKIYLFLIIYLVISLNKLNAQDFLNNDLDGDEDAVNQGMASILPTNWQNVPFTDDNCQATGTITATPDLTGMLGPDPSLGIVGNPYSGNTFVSGIFINYMSWNIIYQEGIMQTVSGFNSGCSYNINFFQSVVKQINCQDPSGSWAVYVDNDLVGISSPTFSNAAFNSTSFIWEFRNLSFTASANSHTIKFLPMDDDSSTDADIDDFQAIRMGIDSIYITTIGNEPIFNLGNDTILCEGEQLTLDATSLNSTYVWQDNSTNPTFTVTQQGKYWVNVTNGCYTKTDTINVSYTALPIINLGNDTTLCEGKTLSLDATSPNSTYLWQDNSTNSTFTVTQPGKYWVELKNNNCSIMHTIHVFYNTLPTNNFLGNDTTICEGKPLFLKEEFLNSTYLWQDNSSESTYTIDQEGTYWVEIINSCWKKSDTLIIKQEKCSCTLYVPNTFSPNNDELNNQFLPLSECNFTEYHLMIFNRWGEIVFDTKDPKKMWDGNYKNKNSPIGIYTYLITYKFENETVKTKHGYINLLR